MRIVGTASITGRGHALITDERWSPELQQSASAKKKIRASDGTQVVELDIRSVEAALKKQDGESRDYLSFMVAPISNPDVEAFLQNREIQLR